MMKLFLILCYCFNVTWLTLFKTTAANDDQSYKILKFGQTTGDYVKFKPNMQPFSDVFSICSWLRKLRSGAGKVWFSYATRPFGSGIAMTDDDESNMKSQAGVTIGSWYHYCVCWDLTSRTATVYRNGTRILSGSTPVGKRLDTDGYLVLGQGQEYYSGEFLGRQVFGGELSKLNVFSKKLSSSEVNEIYSAGRCSEIEKKHDDTRHLKWEDILQQPRTGNVSVITDTSFSCQLEKELKQLERQLAEAV